MSKNLLLRRLLKSTDATAAVEAAIFAPIFLVMMLGITDLGAGMFVRMQVNAAAQAGAAYAVINSRSTCKTLSATCLSDIRTAMNDATGNPSYCTNTTCTALFTPCADANGGICFTITANYSYAPILPAAAYTWAVSPQTNSSTVTVRTQ
jgi:Flp pilus assembly protein TadG